MSGCRVCQSLMKSVPPSRVSFGRGVGEEGVGGRSSGVKDNRIRRAVYIHYTVTQHSHFLPLPFFSSLPSDRSQYHWGTDRWNLCTQLILLKTCQMLHQQQRPWDVWIPSLSALTKVGLQTLLFSVIALTFFNLPCAFVLHCHNILTMYTQRLTPLGYTRHLFDSEAQMEHLTWRAVWLCLSRTVFFCCYSLSFLWIIGQATQS